MKAIRFDAPIPTYLLTRAAGALSKRLFTGPHACTRYGEVAAPTLPGDRWVRLRTRLGGICGSDLAVVTLSASPSTSPLSSMPFVLGHENVGEVIETGPAVRRVRVGERVVANPLLACSVRGLEPPCPACESGRPSRCVRFTDGALPAGMLIGTTRGLGGSWGEQYVAHEEQLVRVAEGVSDEAAVLIEPLACSVHAVRADPPREGERVLVIGAGSIGLLTVAALRAIAPRAVITALARHAFQGEQAARLGAARVVPSGRGAVRALADDSGARLLQPILGPPIAVGGFDRCYVCIGGSAGVEQALRFTRAGGTVVLLGNATTLPGLDWSPIWLKELSVRGSLCYGVHAHGSGSQDAFLEAADLIAGGGCDVAPLVTHVIPLADYSRALAVAMDKGGSRSIKVALRP